MMTPASPESRFSWLFFIDVLLTKQSIMRIIDYENSSLLKLEENIRTTDESKGNEIVWLFCSF